MDPEEKHDETWREAYRANLLIAALLFLLVGVAAIGIIYLWPAFTVPLAPTESTPKTSD
jgi:hypothetical protein